MLDSLFPRPHHVRRLRANPLGKVLDRFAGYLSHRGQKACVVHQLLRAAGHLGSWPGAHNAAVSPDLVTKASIRRFLHEHLTAARARLGLRAASSPAGRRPTTRCGCSTNKTRPD
jgi:integrase/recombinase XerD